MKILITSNGHQHYGKTGEIVSRDDTSYIVRIPHRRGTIQTRVREQQFKELKRQQAHG